jgi:hypothetical protein
MTEAMDDIERLREHETEVSRLPDADAALASAVWDVIAPYVKDVEGDREEAWRRIKRGLRLRGFEVVRAALQDSGS